MADSIVNVSAVKRWTLSFSLDHVSSSLSLPVSLSLSDSLSDFLSLCVALSLSLFLSLSPYSLSLSLSLSLSPYSLSLALDASDLDGLVQRADVVLAGGVGGEGDVARVVLDPVDRRVPADSPPYHMYHMSFPAARALGAAASWAQGGGR